MSNNLRGIAWAFMATALGALSVAMIKSAATDYHVLQILFFRQIIVFISALPFLISTFPDNFYTRFPLIHAVRLAGAFVALTFGIWAVALLPLSTAVTLGFTQVFFVALLAFYYLHEPVSCYRVAVIAMGLIGVIVVARPTLGDITTYYSLVPIVGAFGVAVAKTSVRKLAQTESTATLLAYQAVVIGSISGMSMFWYWTPLPLTDFVLLTSIGISSTLAQWAGVQALRLGEASLLGNIEYMSLIYAMVLGFFFFNEIPDRFTIIGATIIVCSSIYIVKKELAEIHT